jgi:hypothetical protein
MVAKKCKSSVDLKGLLRSTEDFFYLVLLIALASI